MKTENDKALPLLLIADDEPTNIHVLVEALIDDYRIKVATDGVMALELAGLEDQPDLILLDIMMPKLNGFEVCRHLKKNPRTYPIPVMFITSKHTASAEFEGLRLEAIEFICKPVNPATLRMRVRNVIRLKQMQDQLLELSSQDCLTGIANRRRFEEFFESEWRRALRTTSPLGLIMFDVDWFKPFNDRYGHRAGDACLQQVAGTIASQLRRPGDLAARYGGEEFVGILALTRLEEAIAIAEACRSAVQALQIPHAGSSFAVVTISCGVAVSVPSDLSSRTDLLDMADQQLYLAKENGRNRVCWVDY